MFLFTRSLSIDGSAPQNAPFQGSTGKLYGTCYNGGSTGYGTVWQMTNTGGSFTVLRTFSNTGTDGYYPLAAPMEGQDGNLYGTTSGGGPVPYPGTNVGGIIYQLATKLTVIDSMVDSVTSGPSGLGGDTVTINGANFTGATLSSSMACRRVHSGQRPIRSLRQSRTRRRQAM